jgi:replicative DNA helicase
MKREHLDMTERTVLGAMLLGDAVDGLVPEDFYLDSHRRIFTRIQAIRSSGEALDLTTLYGALTRSKELEAVGGLAYISDLTTGVPRRGEFSGYVKLLRKETQRRQIAMFCALAQQRAEEGDEPEEIIAELSSSALGAQMSGADLRPIPIGELVPGFVESLHEQRSHPNACLGVPSGIPSLDRCTTGWRKGELTYVGALPGRGKSSFLLQAMYSAAREGFPVGCISLEMRANQLMRRLAILHTGLSSGKLRDARRMSEEEYGFVRRSALTMGELPIEMQDQSGLKPGQIASLSRRMVSNGARVIFVDFVQIVAGDAREREKEKIDRVSAALRDTCKALDTPFVVASQLARRDADPNRRPTLQDLRESGNLEQDAHNVLMLYRPKDNGTSEWTGEDEILIEKQREGVTGVVPVKYDDQKLIYVERSHVRFSDAPPVAKT